MTGSMDALFRRMDTVMAALDRRMKVDAATAARLEILTAMAAQMVADAPPEQAKRARLLVEGYRVVALTLPPEVGTPFDDEATLVLKALDQAQTAVSPRGDFPQDGGKPPGPPHEREEAGQGGKVVVLRP